MKATTHVLLISDQAAPNLLAALDPDLKPKEAVLVTSRKMRRRAEALGGVLRDVGITVETVNLDDEHDFAGLETALLDIAGVRNGPSVALNVTGGTKLMALAAKSVADTANWSVFYVDVDTDEMIVLGQGRPTRRKLSEHLRLRHYLRSYGFEIEGDIERRGLEPRHRELLQTLIIQVGRMEQALGQLNGLGQDCENKRALRTGLSPTQLDNPDLNALLRNFEGAGVLRVTGDTLQFTSEADRAFACGGWLEQYMYDALTEAQGELGVRDKASNLTVADGSGVKNEIDVAFLARNRLFMVECKTARMDRPESPKANETLFKLSEISKRVGGLGARGMLATYRPLRESERRLANALNIEVICGAELAQTRERLKRWVGPQVGS